MTRAVFTACFYKLAIQFLKSGAVFLERKKYSFCLEENYFIKQNNRIHSLKKLSKKEILFLIPLSKEMKTWIDKNKIDLTREKEVLLFLNYLNPGVASQIR